MATPVSGRLGDRYGKRRIILIATAPLIAGSVLCALSASAATVIVGRGLQGLGMGIIPLGISLLRDVLPPERLGSSIAALSASMGMGGALGLPFAAAERTSWRILFWVTAVLDALFSALVWPLVPSGRPRTGGARFDVPGAIGLGTGLVCLLLGVSKGSDWGWRSGTTLALFAAAVVVPLAWGRWELRTPEPLVGLRVTARPRVLTTNAASILVAFAMYAQSLVVPRLMRLPAATGYGLGQSMPAMGLWMVPGGLMMMAVSPLGAKISAVRGASFTLALGSLVIAAGYGSSMLLLGSTFGLTIVVCICSSGVGLAYGAMPALIMSAVPQEETASANSFNTLMRSTGTSVSAAVMGVIPAQMTTSLGGHALPSEDGFRVAMLTGCGVAVTAACIPSHRRTAAPAPGRPTARLRG